MIFFVYFKLDFYFLCSLLKSVQNRQKIKFKNQFREIEILKIHVQIVRVYLAEDILVQKTTSSALYISDFCSNKQMNNKFLDNLTGKAAEVSYRQLF